MESALVGSVSRHFDITHCVPPPGTALPISDVVLHHLRTPGEIGSVIFLRDEIDLSVHTGTGRQFETLEKKETSAASYADSNSPASGSARSASCRWATN